MRGDALTVGLGDDLTVHRLGFGAMRLTGPGDWGPPTDPDEAARVARRALELGVTFIDTADAYGPGSNEEFLAEVLYPYPAEVVIGTKAGQSRPSRAEWKPLGRPEYLRQQCELSLRRLRVDRIDLFQLHRVDPQVPEDDQFGALRQLQDEGKVRYVGLSEVSVAQIERARQAVDIVSVQNLYNLTDRSSEAVLAHCEANAIGFIPWFPLAAGKLAEPGAALDAIAHKTNATPSQIALAWVLKRSPVMLPIPGTGNVSHLEDNVRAAEIRLTDEDFKALDEQAKAAA